MDPVCAAMATGLPPERDLPGRPVLGVVACGEIVRRQAFLAAGGFEGRLGVGGEEELLALDLAAAGWRLVYVPQIVAHHHPSPIRDRRRRARIVTRNALWTVWLRRPLRRVPRCTVRIVARTRGGGGAAAGVLDAVAGLPWVLRARSVLPSHVEPAREALDRQSVRA